MIALILAGAVLAGVFIRWAIVNDEFDAHLLHGPHDGCEWCTDK